MNAIEHRSVKQIEVWEIFGKKDRRLSSRSSRFCHVGLVYKLRTTSVACRSISRFLAEFEFSTFQTCAFTESRLF